MQNCSFIKTCQWLLCAFIIIIKAYNAHDFMIYHGRQYYFYDLHAVNVQLWCLPPGMQHGHMDGFTLTHQYKNPCNYALHRKNITTRRFNRETQPLLSPTISWRYADLHCITLPSRKKVSSNMYFHTFHFPVLPLYRTIHVHDNIVTVKKIPHIVRTCWDVL